MAQVRRTGARRALRAEATTLAVAGAVSDPELRQLITRMPLWRRPGFLIRRLNQIHYAIFYEECAEFDITPVQYGILTTLSLNPGADQNSIAHDVGIDRTNVADVLSRLTRRGLVRRQRGAEDKRTFVTWLTPDGERLTKAMLGAMRRAQERLLNPLDGAEREQFLATLLRLIDANNDVSRAALGPTRIDKAA
ncbi:MarR family winged helix-turn-helix transcriptional regulator [Humitalea sp. 24SJ18S-53]|uniref:MarR family winged helix-turn-helix transcriptional regulator n=1 Tax=Humitalea sp. 24SJ18S-53 TaxID=3422307 RepID=UPI003D664CD2